MREPRHKTIVGHQMVGGILGMMNDPVLFRRSEVGGKHEYSTWTAEGREALIQYMLEYSRKLLIADDKDIEDRARQMTWHALKENIE